jgi:hypothetical protein
MPIVTAKSEGVGSDVGKLVRARIYAISLVKGLVLMGLLYAGIRITGYALPKYLGFSIPAKGYGLIYGLSFALCMSYVLSDYQKGLLKHRHRPEREKEP